MAVPEKCLSTQLQCSLTLYSRCFIVSKHLIPRAKLEDKVCNYGSVIFIDPCCYWLVNIQVVYTVNTVGNIILELSTIYNTESNTSCEYTENSRVRVSNPALMELHCT